MTDVNLYSREIEALVAHKHKLEAEIARLRASTMPHTDQEREDHILDCYAVIKEKDVEIERLRAVPGAQTERERHEALERARKEGWDAAIADRASTNPTDEILAKATDIISRGCGCDHSCGDRPAACGCWDDARAVLALLTSGQGNAEQ